VLFIFAHKAAGAPSARHSLRPLLTEGQYFAEPGQGIAPRERKSVSEMKWRIKIVFVIPGRA
jgi:hypothetical protein